MRAVLCTFPVLYIWYTQRCGAHCCVFTTTCCIRNIFYSEWVSSDRLLVDIGSLDVSLDDLLAAQSQKSQRKWRLKLWRCLHNNDTGTKLGCAHGKSFSNYIIAQFFKLWCWLHTDLVFAIKRKEKNLFKAECGSRATAAWLLVELPWRIIAECMLVFFSSKQNSVYDS